MIPCSLINPNMGAIESIRTTVTADVREGAKSTVLPEVSDGQTERRGLKGRREQVLLTALDRDLWLEDDEATATLDGVRGRVGQFMKASPATVLPTADDRGIITGPAACFITRAQWNAALQAGLLIVFYDNEEDLKGRVFPCPTDLEGFDDTIGGVIHHARMIRLPGGVKVSGAIPSHDYADYLDRVNEKKITLPDGKTGNMSLGFGDEEKGLINADAMAVLIHDGEKRMEHGEVLPLMELSVPPNMQALHYGSALFEGIGCERSESGEVCIFDMDGHYERMRQGAIDLDLPYPSFEVFKDMAIKTVQANERFIPLFRKGRLYLRPNLFSIGPKMKVGNANQTALVFTATPIGNASSYFGSAKKKMVFGVPTTRVRAAPGMKGNRKAGGNYAQTIEAIHVMKELGLGGGGVAYLDRLTQMDPFPLRENFQEGMLGYVKWRAAMGIWRVRAAINLARLKRAEFKETSASNLVFFKRLEGGRWRVVTPPLGDNDILAGRTRALLEKIVKKFGWEFAEEPVTWADVESGEYEVAAGAGTAAYLTPIHAFQRVDIGSREELGMVDQQELKKCEGDAETERNYKDSHAGKLVGPVVNLLRREELKDEELLPEPIQLIIAEMERVKRGEAEGEAEYAGLITRVTLPVEMVAQS